MIQEKALLKDLIYVLQGVDGSVMKRDDRNKTFSVVNAAQASPSNKQLVERIGECGYMCFLIRREISSEIRNRQGSIRQSLNRAIEAELREYLKLVACYEATLTSEEAEGMNLRKAALWFSESEPKLRLLWLMLQEVQSLNGAMLISIIQKYCSHGDAKLGAVAQRILTELLHPFTMIAVEFVRHGNLCDPYGEFFVKKNDSDDGGGGSNSSRNSNSSSYILQEEKIPSILTKALALRALLAGKTRNFLSSITSEMDIDQYDIEERPCCVRELVGFIKREHQLACQSLSVMLKEKYSLKHHFITIRDFIYFGRGDFANALVDNLSGQLSKPAGSLFRHALVNCLDQALLSLPQESAIKGLRERMDVRLHETINPKLTGWDVFTLDYKIDFPIDVIIGPTAMEQHVKTSHFLWSLRRVAVVLGGCWSRVMNLVQKVSLPNELRIDMKRIQLLIQEGLAIARQINLYAASTVHACWDRFLAKLDNSDGNPSGIDYYVSMHDQLLNEFRTHLSLYSNQSIKVRLAAVLGVLLRLESAVRGYERYIQLAVEHTRRSSNAHPNRPSLSLSFEDEAILNTFSLNAMRMLSEQRAAFQNAARTFHTELDEFLLQLQKFQNGEMYPLLMVVDFGGYHRRRNGFDSRKYCSTFGEH